MKEKVFKPITVVDKDTNETKEVMVEMDASKERFVSTEEYYPDRIVGACSECKLVGRLDLTQGFSYNTGDNVMSRQKVIMFCPRCKRKTYFLPIKINGQFVPKGLEILAKIERDLQADLKGNKK